MKSAVFGPVTAPVRHCLALGVAVASVVLLAASVATAAPFAYVANSNGEISVIDTASSTVSDTLALQGDAVAYDMVVSLDGGRLYALTRRKNASFNEQDRLQVIATATKSVIANFPVDAQGRLVISPIGSRLYMPAFGGIRVIDVDTQTFTTPPALAGNFTDVTFNTEGTVLYRVALGPTAYTFEAVDVSTNAVTYSINLGGPADTSLGSMAVNTTGTRVYVALATTGIDRRIVTGSSRIVVIDTASRSVIATTSVADFPTGITVDSAGTRVYVASGIEFSATPGASKGVLSVIDGADNRLITSVALPYFPQSILSKAVAIDPSGARLYLLAYGENAVGVVDLRCNDVAPGIVASTGPPPPAPAKLYPLSIAIAPSLNVIPPPAVAANQFEITGTEITQGIQDTANNVPLIIGRRTFVRVYVRSLGAAIPGVTATLSATGQIPCTPGTCPPLPTSAERTILIPINSVGPRITVRPNPKRANLNDSFLFELPSEWVNNFKSLRIHAVVSADPGVVPAKSCFSDLAKEPLHVFQSETTLKVQFVRLSYRLPGTFNGVTNALIETSIDEQLRSESFMRRVYPLSELQIAPDLPLFDAGLGLHVARLAPECLTKPPADQNMCAHDYVTKRLVALQFSSGPFGMLPGPPGSGFIATSDAAYGLIPQVPNDTKGLYFTRGKCCTARIGAGPSDQEEYAAHEVGHFLGRMHPVEGSASCGHSPDDPYYPYYASFIGPGSAGPNPSFHGDSDLAGFDVGDPNLLIPQSFLSGQGAFDNMGYCRTKSVPLKWTSDYTYNNNYVCLLALHGLPGLMPGCGPAGGAGPVVAQTGDFLAVVGEISGSAAAADFIAQRVQRVFNPPALTSGSHAVRLVGAAGETLAEYAFAPTDVADAVTAGSTAVARSFGQVVPFVSGTRGIQIIDKAAGNRVIGTRVVSPTRPDIRAISVQAASNPASGIVTLGWTASDADGDPLTFDVFFTRDAGASLQPVTLGVSGPGAQIDTANLPGGPGQFRVVASDGVQTAFADSPLLTLTNKAPAPRVISPGASATIVQGQLISLEGRATDPQDGAIVGSGLTWTLAGRSLGSGPRLTITDLPVGTDTITFRATNSLGLSASTDTMVTVNAYVDAPGPMLTVGPARIGWNVAAGSTQMQTATLEVGNAGSGELRFTATTSAPWLTVSVGAGTAPASLILSADPSGVPISGVETATVTLTALGTPGQAVTIPVALAVGNSFTARPVAVAVSQRGDINGDGQVDRLDVALITAALNSRASGPDDPRDLNHDGVINALDARIVVSLCTHPGCTVH
jgi:hypothetical protein